jgi:hypothetical protein
LKKTKANGSRRFKSDSQVMHDLYKLESSLMLKNVAIDGHQPEYMKLEHCHIYHTVDSRGQPQDKCSPIGGHFHMIEVVTPSDGDNPPELRCSGPKKYVLDNVTKKKIIVASEESDTHTHKVSYISSEEFKPRKINMEAQRFVAAEQAKEPAPVPGIL